MRIATWNVNSIRQRIEPLLAWLKDCSPDIVCLQETKCVDEAFPRLEIESLGYNVVTHGQKTFNGVALLSVSRARIARISARSAAGKCAPVEHTAILRSRVARPRRKSSTISGLRVSTGCLPQILLAKH
jgi:exonuclease III